MVRMLALGLVFFVVAGSSAQARRHQEAAAPVFDRHAVNGNYSYSPVSAPRVERRRRVRTATVHRSQPHHVERRIHVAARGEAQILPHPAGCPRISFCGCGVAIEVFGRPIRELWLAANWFRFPPAAPAPGMVAVRRHHVFVIREVRAPGLVLAYDPNSGGHRTRLHLRSLAGYSVRNPHGGARYATAG